MKEVVAQEHSEKYKHLKMSDLKKHLKEIKLLF
jgi:hypothetical protein